MFCDERYRSTVLRAVHAINDSDNAIESANDTAVAAADASKCTPARVGTSVFARSAATMAPVVLVSLPARRELVDLLEHNASAGAAMTA